MIKQTMRLGRLILPFLVSLGLALALVRALGGQHTRAVVVAEHRCRAQVDGDTYPTLQAAVDAASPGALVKVAGYCAGVEERAGLTQTVYISKSVTLRGGYTVTNWMTPDRAASPTVLDAEGRGRVITIMGPPADAGEKLSVTIEGLEITGGDARGLGGGRLGGDAGGGVYGWNAAIVIRDTQVFESESQRGGGLYLYSGAADVERVSVVNNSAEWTGGGLYLDEVSDVSLMGSTVFSNAARWDGGGLYMRGCTATLAANSFTANTTHQSGAGLYLRFSNALLDDNDVAYGRADQNGGGAYLDRNDAITMTDSTITRNQAGGDGGGIYLDESPTWLSRSRIIANTAAEGGGGLNVLETDSALIVNAIIGDNRGQQGSGVCISSSSVDLVHVTIVSNAIGSGVDVGEASTATLTNTILVSHTAGLCVSQGGRAVLEATLWSGDSVGKVGLCDGEGAVVTGTRNYWGDPRFVNPGASDYHIAPGSAAVNKGVSTGVGGDIDGDPRPTDGATDLGADEIWQVHLPSVLKLGVDPAGG